MSAPSLVSSSTAAASATTSTLSVPPAPKITEGMPPLPPSVNTKPLQESTINGDKKTSATALPTIQTLNTLLQQALSNTQQVERSLIQARAISAINKHMIGGAQARKAFLDYVYGLIQQNVKTTQDWLASQEELLQKAKGIQTQSREERIQLLQARASLRSFITCLGSRLNSTCISEQREALYCLDPSQRPGMIGKAGALVGHAVSYMTGRSRTAPALSISSSEPSSSVSASHRPDQEISSTQSPANPFSLLLLSPPSPYVYSPTPTHPLPVIIAPSIPKDSPRQALKDYAQSNGTNFQMLLDQIPRLHAELNQAYALQATINALTKEYRGECDLTVQTTIATLKTQLFQIQQKILEIHKALEVRLQDIKDILTKMKNPIEISEKPNIAEHLDNLADTATIKKQLETELETYLSVLNHSVNSTSREVCSNIQRIISQVEKVTWKISQDQARQATTKDSASTNSEDSLQKAAKPS